MNEEQKTIALRAVADVVIDGASNGRERPSAAALRQLAEDTAAAIAAGFRKLSEST